MSETLPSLCQDYQLDAQIGFLMRRANQRHLALFARHIPELTATQFAALARLCQGGEMSQNALGRATAMDGATIKGVVDRLRARGLVDASSDPSDQRRRVLRATAEGQALFERLVPGALTATRDTLAPLNAQEQHQFQSLLARLL
ncbi:MAG: MarR family winged helix-turn-helix transcriptional regulator [Sedimentitalea sp.]